MGTLHGHLCAFMISHSVLLRKRNVLDNSYRENQNTSFKFNNFLFLKNHAIYEVMWKNNVESDRPQMTVWCMHIACWIMKATNTHSDYAILNAFPGKNDYMNVPQCYVYTYIICLTVLF